MNSTQRDRSILARRHQLLRERVTREAWRTMLLSRSKVIQDKAARYLWLCRRGFYTDKENES